MSIQTLTVGGRRKEACRWAQQRLSGAEGSPGPLQLAVAGSLKTQVMLPPSPTPVWPKGHHQGLGPTGHAREADPWASHLSFPGSAWLGCVLAGVTTGTLQEALWPGG